MRSEGLTGTALITMICLLLLQPAVAAAQDGDAVSLVGDTGGIQDGQLLSVEAGATEPASELSDSEHPVYHLRLEPFSDEGALTLGLDELLALAVEHNLGLARQYYNVEKGHYSVDQTYYAFDPTLSGSLSYSSNTASMAGGALGSSSSYSGASISYAIPQEFGDSFEFSYAAGSSGDPSDDDSLKSGSLGLRYRRPLERGAGYYYNRIGRYIASNNLLLSYDKLDDDVRSLKKRVLDAYYLAVSARRTIDVREASLEVALQQLERSVERYKVGMAIRTELLQAENSVLTQRASLLGAHKNFDNLLDSLSVLLGLPQEIKLVIDADSALVTLGSGELSAELWELVLANSYELKSLNMQLNNLRLSRDQQLHQLKPDVSLSLSYDRSSADNNAGRAFTGLDDVDYGANLSWSTTPGKRAARAGLAQTELDLASLDLSIQELELTLKARLRELERDLSTLYQQIELAEGNLAVIRETLTIQQERLDVGLAVTLDVVEAQEDVLAAELALLSARVAYQQAYREILLMAGLI